MKNTEDKTMRDVFNQSTTLIDHLHNAVHFPNRWVPLIPIIKVFNRGKTDIRDGKEVPRDNVAYAAENAYISRYILSYNFSGDSTDSFWRPETDRIFKKYMLITPNEDAIEKAGTSGAGYKKLLSVQTIVSLMSKDGALTKFPTNLTTRLTELCEKAKIVENDIYLFGTDARQLFRKGQIAGDDRKDIETFSALKAYVQYIHPSIPEHRMLSWKKIPDCQDQEWIGFLKQLKARQ